MVDYQCVVNTCCAGSRVRLNGSQCFHRNWLAGAVKLVRARSCHTMTYADIKPISAPRRTVTLLERHVERRWWEEQWGGTGGMIFDLEMLNPNMFLYIFGTSLPYNPGMLNPNSFPTCLRYFPTRITRAAAVSTVPLALFLLFSSSHVSWPILSKFIPSCG